MKHKGESGGGNDKRSPTRRVAPRGARSGARGAANLCHSALGLCAALRPMAALAACGRWAKLTERRATEGEERLPEVAARSALRPRPRASGRMSRANLELARGRGGNGAAPYWAKSGHGGRRAKTERAWEQSQQAQRPRSPTGLGAVRRRVTSRDRGAAIIPQRVTARTETAPRSGSRRPRGCGGGGAPASAQPSALILCVAKGASEASALSAAFVLILIAFFMVGFVVIHSFGFSSSRPRQAPRRGART